MSYVGLLFGVAIAAALLGLAIDLWRNPLKTEPRKEMRYNRRKHRIECVMRERVVDGRKG